MSLDVPSLAAAFGLQGRVHEAKPHGTGHINDTYLVTLDAKHILQRINHRIFKDIPGLMENIRRVTTHLAACGHPTVTLRSTPAGAPFHFDGESYWRCYAFIEGAHSIETATPYHAYEAARAFGAFQRALASLPPPRLIETIPHFHNTPLRLQALQNSIASDAHGRVAAARPEIDAALARAPLASTLVDLQASGQIPERIAHNDTKLNNVLFDDATGASVCVLDLDTVMPGLALYDFGDMVRTGASSAAEDEADPTKVYLRTDLYDQIHTGYLSTAGALLTAAERDHLPIAAQVITYEQAIRFLADYLNGDTYYKCAYPAHNLTRTRAQLALVASMESTLR